MNKRTLANLVLGAALAVAAAPAAAERTIAEFSGDSSTVTKEFSVSAPWIVDWRVTGEPGQFEVVTIALVDAMTGRYEGQALKTKSAGNGVRLFESGGRFYFRVDASLMNWSLKVIQLTPEEAAQYKPR